MKYPPMYQELEVIRQRHNIGMKKPKKKSKRLISVSEVKLNILRSMNKMTRVIHDPLLEDDNARVQVAEIVRTLAEAYVHLHNAT